MRIVAGVWRVSANSAHASQRSGPQNAPRFELFALRPSGWSRRRPSQDPGSTIDDLREAAMTLEEVERTARRVFGGSHPLTVDIEGDLRNARAALRARKTPPPPGFA